MAKIPFKTKYVDLDENVMDIRGLNASEIRFNRKTREISIVISDTYIREDLDQCSWQEIKKLVEHYGGRWQSSEKGIKFLIGKKKVAI